LGVKNAVKEWLRIRKEKVTDESKTASKQSFENQEHNEFDLGGEGMILQ
jgi:hypothetical protein